MILDSFDNAEEDITNRQVIEARNEANTILEAVDKGKKNPVWQQLTPAEHDSIAAATTALQSSLNSNDHHHIRNAIGTLDQATRRFAELMMDSAVTGAMRGQTMQSAGNAMGQNLGATPSAPHAFAPAQISESQSIDELEQDADTPGNSTED